MQISGKLPDYPLNACTVWGFVTKLKEFQGENINIPPETLDYFFNSATMNQPGQTLLPQQVEVDLSRFYSIRLNGSILYDKHQEAQISMTPPQIFYKLKECLSDFDIALNCSKLLTQATFAEPTKDFFQKFTHFPLQYMMTNQFTTDIVVNTLDRENKPLNTIALYFHVILAIQDHSGIHEVTKSEDLFIQGYCLISRQILIPKESLKQGVSTGATIQDCYSKFFETKDEVFAHLDSLIAEESTLPLPANPPSGSCIIA